MGATPKEKNVAINVAKKDFDGVQRMGETTKGKNVAINVAKKTKGPCWNSKNGRKNKGEKCSNKCG